MVGPHFVWNTKYSYSFVETIQCSNSPIISGALNVACRPRKTRQLQNEQRNAILLICGFHQYATYYLEWEWCIRTRRLTTLAWRAIVFSWSIRCIDCLSFFRLTLILLRNKCP